jgi:hypothetical protein
MCKIRSFSSEKYNNKLLIQILTFEIIINQIA